MTKHPMVQAVRPCLEAYGLVPKSIQVLPHGTYCEVFKVITGSGSFVARIRAPEACGKEIVFANKWATAVSVEVPVPVPLAASDDGVPQCHHRYVDVAPFIESDSDVEPGPDSWEQVGQWLGSMHRLGQSVLAEAPFELDYGNHPHSALFGRYLSQARVGCQNADELKLMRRVDSVVERIRVATDSMKESLPVGVVHGDFHFWNVLYRGGHPVAVIDLDFLQRGTLVHDLAYASHWLVEWAKRGGPWANIRERYLAAYESGRQLSLTADERDGLPWLHAYSSIFFFLSKVRISWRRVAQDMHDLEDAEILLQSLR